MTTETNEGRKLSPFDFINSINSRDKKNVMADAADEAAYVPFVVNRGLSYFIDTIAQASEMNRNAHIPSRMQYEFYMGAVKPAKRFSKWHKRTDEADLTTVMKAMKCNRHRAREFLPLLGVEGLEAARAALEVGGS